ncbi:MAG: HEAT repeat domain-containing protein [Lachnospiraceae bacterium]
MGLFGGNEAEKLEKLAEKGKGDKVVELLRKKNTDKDTLLKGLEICGKLGGEDPINFITEKLQDSDPDVRIAAGKAALATGTDYMKTSVQQMLGSEKDQKVIDEVRAVYREKYMK